MKAYEEKKGMTIKMSRTQLAYNMKIEGRYLPMLAGLIPFLTGLILGPNSPFKNIPILGMIL